MTWKLPGLTKAYRTLAEPQWHGEAAAGRTLLIHAEQSFADTLRFCRYAPLAAALGFRVILEVQAPLVRLLRALPGVDRVVPSGSALPAFDVHCPLLGLPLAMRTTLARTPAAGSYLQANEAQIAAWRTRLAAMPDQALRVGLAWAGNPRVAVPDVAATDRRRSMAPDRMAPLFDVPGVRFFSLRKDGPRAPERFPLTDFMREMTDFADTAGLIVNLDLVIAVDTAIAHLAAALGKPVWLLDRFDSCWSWLIDRRDGPWYPGLRLYRQQQPGDWARVVREVARDLRDLVGSGQRSRAGTPPDEPVRLSPDVQVLLAEAIQHHRAERLGEAERLYRKILMAAPRNADALHLLGVVAHRTGRHGAALDLISQAIAIDPDAAPFHSNLGNMLREQGQRDEAVTALRRAIELAPDEPISHFNLGLALSEQGCPEQAAVSYRRTIALRPDHADAFNNLGVALGEQGRPDEAVLCYRRVLELRADSADAHNSLGGGLTRLGLWNEAAGCFRHALLLRPDFADAHTNLAMALLALGDMPAGWREYEWRWQTPPMAGSRRDFAQPQWRGGAADGSTLLIHAEQGFGDTLQFCRYAALAADRGLRVILEVQKPLVRLLSFLPGIERVMARGEKLPPFDLHCPMLSMPAALETTIATIPGAASYLRADPAQVAVWQARLRVTAGHGPRVGLVWAGNPRPHIPALTATDRRRSLAPDRLAPLFDVPGVHFVSLQRDGPAAPDGFPLIDFMAEMVDFADTAALIANLDLVISVDTAVAHLAAALGKPVWLLDRFDSCWRWLTGRRDSPWYPTLRLYRQPAPGDWDPVLAEVARDLRALAETRQARQTRGGARSPEPDLQALLADAIEHHRADRLSEAERLYDQILTVDPAQVDALHLLGVVTHRLGRHGPAVDLINRAIEISPDVAPFHSNLGNMIREQGRLDEAVAALGRAIELKPDFADAHANLGLALHQLGSLRDAVACYRRAIELKIDYPDAHFNLATALLALGDMAAGWEEYEWRWMLAEGIKDRRDFAQPQWRGEPAEGRTLLIHAEQGFGDTLHFCRYAERAAVHGFRVILEVQGPLVRLLQDLPGVQRVLARGQELPAFDVHCPLLSMPLAMRTTLTTIPGTSPYLYANEARTAFWRARLAATSNQGLLVGVVWAGDPRPNVPSAAAIDRRRSMTADRLAPVFDVTGVHFVSLQKHGPAAPPRFRLTDFMHEMADFADTAALIANLDLVISVDTAVAHLAAALGKPVWLLDRFDSCWRWLTNRRDSPWYTGLRIYRQPAPGDWGPVLAEVARDLHGLADAGGRPCTLGVQPTLQVTGQPVGL